MADSPPRSLRPETLLPAGKLPTSLLAGLLARHRIDDPSVIVGPGVGRDAAAIQLGDLTLVLKNDPITFATESAPYYLVNVNANDLACLGATPRWMLVTALLPEGRTTVAEVERQFVDLQSACERAGISLIGGHTEITAGLDRPILVGFLIGLVGAAGLLQPGGGRPGHRLALTKAIATEGTALLARERRTELAGALGRAVIDRAADLLFDPGISVIPEAEAMRTAGGVTALHDPTEGGLATGIRELAEACDCGAVVNEALIPTWPETRAIADHLGLDPLGMLASGSLLAAVEPASVGQVEAACAALGVACAWIGKLTPRERGLTLLRGGQPTPLPEFTRDEVSRVLTA